MANLVKKSGQESTYVQFFAKNWTYFSFRPFFDIKLDIYQYLSIFMGNEADDMGCEPISNSLIYRFLFLP